MTRSTSHLLLLGMCVLGFAAPSRAADGPADGNPAEGEWRSLMDTVDPRMADAGQWKKSAKGLSTDAVASSRLSIPVRPPAEYDFRVEFTRHSGQHSIALAFVLGSRQATFEVDAWGEHLAGLQMINGQDMRANGVVVRNQALENGRRYTARVEVRRNIVRGFLDDKLLVSHRTDGSDLSMLNLWKLRRTDTLGLGAFEAETTFHRVELRPVAKNAPTASSSRPSLPASRPSPAPAKTDATERLTSLEALNDEFTDPATRSRWRRLYRDEKWNANQLERFDIGRYREGWMTLSPFTSVWFRDWRGVLVHRRVQGDFVVTTRVRTTNRRGNGAPRSAFSLAGLMVRTPRDITPATWRPGGENYLFLTHGSASEAGRYQFEVKNTINSDSQLAMAAASSDTVDLRIARIGPSFLLLSRSNPAEQWRVHRRYSRPDMPEELQVGLTAYSDWNRAQRISPQTHNRTVIRDGRPDLIASFQFARFQRPKTPAELRTRDLSSPSQASDAQLLQFLGRRIDGPPKASR